MRKARALRKAGWHALHRVCRFPHIITAHKLPVQTGIFPWPRRLIDGVSADTTGMSQVGAILSYRYVSSNFVRMCRQQTPSKADHYRILAKNKSVRFNIKFSYSLKGKLYSSVINFTIFCSNYNKRWEYWSKYITMKRNENVVHENGIYWLYDQDKTAKRSRICEDPSKIRWSTKEHLNKHDNNIIVFVLWLNLIFFIR